MAQQAFTRSFGSESYEHGELRPIRVRRRLTGSKIPFHFADQFPLGLFRVIRLAEYMRESRPWCFWLWISGSLMQRSNRMENRFYGAERLAR